MMDQPTENSSALPPDEELVAYLDGELDTAARTAIEDRLAVDRDLREQLQRLQQTWDCLDQLPATNVDEKFTQTTIAMAAVAASQELAVIENKAAASQSVRRIVMTGALAASLLVGLLLASVLWPDPNAQLLDRLDVFVRLDAYQSLESVDFLRELDKQQFFTAAAETAAAESAVTGSTLAQAPVLKASAQRSQWIAGLAPDEKNQLAEQQRRFEALPPEVQRRTVEIARQISQDPAAGRLLETLDRYYQWLITITPGQRADLAVLEPPQRLAEMRAMQQRLNRDESERQRSIHERIRPLNLTDVEKLTDWMRRVLTGHIAENRDRYLSRVPQMMRDHFEKMPQKQQDDMLLAMAWRGFMTAEQFDNSGVTQSDIQSLVASLSPDAQQAFHKAEDAEQRKRLLVDWLRTSLFVRWRSGGRSNHFVRVTEEELERHFVEKLTSDERAELLALPPERMRDRLRDSYFGHDSHSDGPNRHFGPPSGGDPERRPGRGHFRRPGGEPDGPDRGPGPPRRDREQDER